MISDYALHRFYEEIGIAPRDGEPASNEGRRRKIKEAVAEIWPLICRDAREEPAEWMTK